jgi:hypothetical protein
MRASLDDADKEALGLTTQRILQQSVVAADRSVMAKRRS